ncbi:hypothetical protein BKI52_13005 [marine bacterium AO1-C]|nr:hypothetical protein BKI52_13005 [marine bacterium AO1-C]
MQFSLFSTLLFIGIIQGLVTSVILLLTKHNKRSNRFLAFAILALCLLSTNRILHSLGLWHTHYLRFFPSSAEVLIAPSFYFFIIYLLHSNRKFTWKQALHFLPFAVFQSYSFFVYFYTLTTPSLYEKDLIAESLHFGFIKNIIEEGIGNTLTVIYTALGYKDLRSYRIWLKNTNADNSYPDFSWLWRLFTLCIILVAYLTTGHLLHVFFRLNDVFTLHWDLFSIYLAFVVYYVGFAGYKQSHVEVAINMTKNLKVNSSNITKSEVQNIAHLLEKSMMQDKLFLNPTLSLKEVSDALDVSQRNLSYTINQHFQKSFRELINEYRIEEIKTQLNDENLKKRSIFGIAMDCGFNSEASFYRVFKKNTGSSPKEFLHANSH